MFDADGPEGPAVRRHVHIAPVQPGPVRTGLQEDQSHTELPGREAAPPGGEAAKAGTGNDQKETGSGGRERADDVVVDVQEERGGPQSVFTHQEHQEQDGTVSGPQETEDVIEGSVLKVGKN